MKKKRGVLRELLEKSKGRIVIARSMLSLNAESQSRARKTYCKKKREKKFGAIIFSIFVRPMNDTIILSYSYIPSVARNYMFVNYAWLRIKLHDAVECQNGNSWLQV